MSNPNYGVITEQGDLGLGFNVLSEQEQETLQEQYGEKREEQNKK